ncbi:MAG: hypothetical protein J6032_03700 [Bacteroidales bacterium]|nr:hypothetical protein [Bacteroidales bacterium]
MSIAMMALVCVSFVSCNDDDDKGGGSGKGSGSTTIGGKSYKLPYATYVPGGEYEGQYYNLIMVSNLDTNHPEKVSLKSKWTYMTIAIFQDQPWGYQSIPVGTSEAFVEFFINQALEGEEGDDYKEGWAEGPILISKNGDTYTLEFSSDYAYMEGQGQDQITVSLKYKGGIGDGTEIWGEYDEK